MEFYRISIQYKTFQFIDFKDDIWHASSVTIHASLDTILEVCSYFAQRLKVNRLNFLPNEVLKYSISS